MLVITYHLITICERFDQVVSILMKAVFQPSHKIGHQLTIDCSHFSIASFSSSSVQGSWEFFRNPPQKNLNCLNQVIHMGCPQNVKLPFLRKYASYANMQCSTACGFMATEMAFNSKGLWDAGQ